MKTVTYQALVPPQPCHHLWTGLCSFLENQAKPKPNPTPRNVPCSEPEAYEGNCFTQPTQDTESS